MDMTKIKAWLRQPTTIHGLGAIAASAGVEINAVLTHTTSPWEALALFAGGVVMAIMPDNTTVVKPVEAFVRDAAQAVVEKKVAEALPKIFSDAVQIGEAVAPGPGAALNPPPQPGPQA